MEDKGKKKRGATEGNQHARKHGFYAKVLDAVQKRNLETAYGIEAIDEEIALMRVKIKSLLEKDPENLKLIMTALKTLAGLLKINFNLNPHQKKGIAESIGQVIREIGLPLGVTAISEVIKKKL
jgi:hypothetical protein